MNLIVEPANTSFIQQDLAATDARAGYWYYCTDPAGYYPYVQSCNQGWVAVIPQAPSDPPSAPRLAPP